MVIEAYWSMILTELKRRNLNWSHVDWGYVVKCYHEGYSVAECVDAIFADHLFRDAGGQDAP